MKVPEVKQVGVADDCDAMAVTMQMFAVISRCLGPNA